MTTLNAAFDRVAMHSTRRALVEMQAQAAGLPLIVAPIPWPCSNAEYEAAMKRVCDHALAQGISAIAFGDLFLTDVRAYRERQLKDTGLEPLFPIWGIPTQALAQEMISAGLRAKLVCVDPKQISPSFVGRDFDQSLLQDLPAGADPRVLRDSRAGLAVRRLLRADRAVHGRRGPTGQRCALRAPRRHAWRRHPAALLAVDRFDALLTATPPRSPGGAL